MANTTDPLDIQSRIAAMVQQSGSTEFDKYTTPLGTRWSSAEMLRLFSSRSRHSTWRKLWLYLAESQKELGVESITDEALRQMRENLIVTTEDFAVAQAEEKALRHDVMAHVHTFGKVAPAAAGIIHYGVSLLYSQCCRCECKS